MYDQAITALDSVKSLQESNTVLSDKNRKLETQNTKILEQNKKLDNKLKLTLSENQYLKAFIKKHYGVDIASAIVSKAEARLALQLQPLMN